MKFPQPFFYIHTGRSLIDFYSKVVGFLRLSVFFFFSSTWSSKITVTKEKKERTRRKKEKEEKKTTVVLLAEKQKKTSGTQLWKRKLTMVRVCKSSPKSDLYLTITFNYLSVNCSCAQLPPPPPGWPPGISMANSRGWDSWAVKSPGVGTIFRFN